MVRFKVVKGSHLLLAVAIIVLIAAIAFILIQEGAAPSESAGAGAQMQILQTNPTEEAKALSAFASNASAPGPLQIEILRDAPQDDPALDAPSILIYHTHTHEAYAQNSFDPYPAVETWRTTDTEHSVVRVGTALAQVLTELGYRVVHDTTDHEQDALSSAYLRSLETLERYEESFDLRIDLHRDAYVDGLPPYLESEDGVKYAQLMLLVGRADAYEGTEKPPYEENLAFAQLLTGELNARIPGIGRNVTVKKGRYNQHVDRRCILVEVGHTLNTLEQALASVPCLAEAIDASLRRYAH